jgi:hypothetical protein
MSAAAKKKQAEEAEGDEERKPKPGIPKRPAGRLKRSFIGRTTAKKDAAQENLDAAATTRKPAVD